MYVGITLRPCKTRWKEHINDRRLNKFHVAIEQYGPDDFEVVELFVYPTWEQAQEAEIALVAALNLINDGYNTALGGGSSPMANPVVARKVADANRGKPRSDVTKAKISSRLRGLKRTPEQRYQMSLTRTGMTMSPATRAKIAMANKGRQFTDEHKAKLSQAQRRNRECALSLH